jgi:hypothetical protein
MTSSRIAQWRSSVEKTDRRRPINRGRLPLLFDRRRRGSRREIRGHSIFEQWVMGKTPIVGCRHLNRSCIAERGFITMDRILVTT